MVDTGKLRYYALGAYTGLVALFAVVRPDIILADAGTIAIALAPIAGVITADIVKHRSE